MTPWIACFITKNCTDVGPWEKMERLEEAVPVPVLVEALLKEEEAAEKLGAEAEVADVVAVVPVKEERKVTTWEPDFPTREVCGVTECW
mmetsp:Transcript_35606/g.76894  ORF Transcript_35606/g.76894 Transcript_35606/m.76894 type:complete len:89 (+) Transcript_35606:1097-1363(+)